MNIFNEQLENLQRQIYEKKRIEAEIEFLEARESELNRSIFNLDYDRKKEQSDVDALESNSLSAFVYRIMGKLDDKINKEKQEAIAAHAKYEAAVSELEALHKELVLRRERLQAVRNCESLYASMLQQKRKSIRNAASPISSRLMELESSILALEHKKTEISEAIHAGRAASNMADGVLSTLSNANDMATWDMLGGGFISDIMKHSSLDDAQRRINQLQIQLNRFKTELSDVNVGSDVQVSIDGFLRFADYFFDGFFVDWAVKDRIHQSQRSVEDVKQKITSIIRKLEGMRSNIESQITQINGEIEDLIRNA